MRLQVAAGRGLPISGVTSVTKQSRTETSPRRKKKLKIYNNVKMHRTWTEVLGRRKQRKLTYETWSFITEGL